MWYYPVEGRIHFNVLNQGRSEPTWYSPKMCVWFWLMKAHVYRIQNLFWYLWSGFHLIQWSLTKVYDFVICTSRYWLQMALLSVRMPIVGLHICYRLKCKFSIAFLAEPISCTDIAFALKAEKNSFPFPTYPSSSYSLYVANNKNSSEHVMHGRLCSINSIHIWSVFSLQAYKRRKAN